MFKLELDIRKLLIAIIALVVLSACSSNECKLAEIEDFFFDNEEVQAARQQWSEVNREWKELMYNPEAYSSEAIVERYSELRIEASKAYDDLAAITPPKCLRGYWDKGIEASRLEAHIIDLTWLFYSGHPSATQEEIDELMAECSALRRDGAEELKNILDKHDLQIDSW